MPRNYDEDLVALMNIAPEEFRDRVEELLAKVREGKILSDDETGEIEWMWNATFERM